MKDTLSRALNDDDAEGELILLVPFWRPRRTGAPGAISRGPAVVLSFDEHRARLRERSADAGRTPERR
ncbi:MAG: hypothetical protein KC657_02275 [Myxococcales bacterium]|nr:hypothetical protein [Myxococcales bacterium]